MFGEVQNFIAQKTGLAAEEIQPDTQLIHLGVDSMKLLMTIMDFEKEFDVKISDRELESVHTVNDLVKIAEKQ